MGSCGYSVVISTAFAVIPETDSVLILGSKALREKLGIDAMAPLKGKAQGGDRSSGDMPEDVGCRGGISLRRVAVTMKSVQAAGKVAAAMEPRDAFVEDVVARGPAMFMEDGNGVIARQDIYTDGKEVLDSPLGSVVRCENGLYRVDYGGMQVIWVPPAERSLQVRLMVCAHMQEDGHRGICATMHRLGAYCVWEGMKFVQQCLHYVDFRLGNVVTRPMVEIFHGAEVGDVLHFDYHLELGDSDDGYAYVLVLVDNVNSFVSLQPAASCTSEVAARSILEWVSGLGTPEVFVSDGAPHFKNETLKLVGAKLGASHRFSGAYSLWSNGTVERMNLEVVRTFRAVMSERGRPLSK